MSKAAKTAKKFSHLDERGAARMVGVGHKPVQLRRAVAAGALVCRRSTIAALKAKALPKGDVLTVAQIAGIQAVKRCAELIPLCHTLLLTKVAVDFEIDEAESRVVIAATVRCNGQTGVEMEALTAVSLAALTIYDMAKALDKGMTIGAICLLEKEGGKSGRWQRGGV